MTRKEKRLLNDMVAEANKVMVDAVLKGETIGDTQVGRIKALNELKEAFEKLSEPDESEAE